MKQSGSSASAGENADWRGGAFACGRGVGAAGDAACFAATLSLAARLDGRPATALELASPGGRAGLGAAFVEAHVVVAARGGAAPPPPHPASRRLDLAVAFDRDAEAEARRALRAGGVLVDAAVLGSPSAVEAGRRAAAALGEACARGATPMGEAALLGALDALLGDAPARRRAFADGARRGAAAASARIAAEACVGRIAARMSTAEQAALAHALSAIRGAAAALGGESARLEARAAAGFEALLGAPSRGVFARGVLARAPRSLGADCALFRRDVAAVAADLTSARVAAAEAALAWPLGSPAHRSARRAAALSLWARATGC